MFTFASDVAAQIDDSNPAVYWRLERERQEAARRVIQQPTRMTRGVAPRRGFAREAPVVPPPAAEAPTDVRSEDGTPVEAASAPAPAPAEATPAPLGPPFAIAVFGDNVGQLLAQGIAEAYAGRPNVTVQRRTRETSGFVRDDFHDWPKAAQEFLAGEPKIDVAIMMVGSNDRQAMRDGTMSLETLSPRWRELYAARVAAFVEAFQRRNVPLVWVGMPVMKNERLSADLAQMNAIYREVVARAGGVYVDVWEAFGDERNRFVLHGPDVNGAITRLRTGDGVHFTRAGARKLAYFAEGEVKKLMDRRTPAPVVAPEPVIVDAPALAPLAPEPSAADALASPAAPAPVAAPARPVAGPVIPLNAAVASPGGELAARPPGGEYAARAARAAGEAKSGRADDFAWPR